MTKPHNYHADVHNEDYLKQFFRRISENDWLWDTGRKKESLNGRWNFGIDQYDACLRAQWFREKDQDDAGRPIPLDYDFDRWEVVPVPSCWNMNREKYFYYEGSAVYTRRFHCRKKAGERLFIKIGAANYESRVFLNREFLGVHQGGSTPFFVEITEMVEANNRLLLIVNNSRKSSNVPRENTDWFNYGGLYRDVELIRVPTSFIRDFQLYLAPGSEFQRLHLDLAVDGPARHGRAHLEIPELDVDLGIEIVDGKGSIEFEARLELWSPESPKLYDVSFNFVDDRISDQIGFREIKVEGTDIFLNGKKIFLRGVCCHEESVKNGKALTEEEILENIALAKGMNCNFMRLAHYPHSEKVAQLADRLGLLLWEEIPVYWLIAFNNEATYQDAENQLIELIKRDQNRASVIIWSVGNENADTNDRLKFMSGLAQKAKEMDPTRLVSAACLVDKVENMIHDRLADYLDVIGLNEYYGWYDPDFSKLPLIFENSRPGKPVIITEFGAGALAGERGTTEDLFTEDFQEAVYQQQVAVFAKIPYIKGTCPWILYDFRCPRRLNVYQDYYNRKGLLSADKTRKKLAYYVMQAFYAGLKKLGDDV